MRHIYIRGIVGFIWLAAAVVSIISGHCEMAVAYVRCGGGFRDSAYAAWKIGLVHKGGEVK